MPATQRLALVRIAFLGAIVGLGTAVAGASDGVGGWSAGVAHTSPAASRAPRHAPGGPGLATALDDRGPFVEWLAAHPQARPSGWTLQAAAAITPGGPIGGDIPICDLPDAVSTSEGLDASTAAFNPAQGQFLVVWQAFDRRTLTNIYGQRVTNQGEMVDSRFPICNTPGGQVLPSVSFETTTGTFWVTWTDFRTGKAEVRLQRVSAAGALLGNEILVSEGAAEAFGARVACRSGSCAVAWAADAGDGTAQVLIRSFAAATGAASSPSTPLSEAGVAASEPDVGWNGDDDRFMVVWRQWNGGSGWDIWSDHLDGNLQSLDRKVICAAINNQFGARVAYGQGAKAYLAVWQDGRNNVHWDVVGQRMTRAGALTGANFGIFTGAYDDIAPAVSGHGGTSEFVVAFQRDILGATGFQIYACRVTGAGAVGSAYVVREAYNWRSGPSIVHRTGSDDYLVTFTENLLATQADIDAQIMRNGSPFSPLRVISRGRKGQERPAVAYGSSRNEYLAAWADYRDGADYDIYFRRVSGAGVPQGQEAALAWISSQHGSPALAHNPDADEYLAVWHELTSDALGFEIYGRRLSGAGVLLGGPILVSRDTDTHSEGWPRVLRNPATGGYLVVWHAFTSGRWHIWGQRLSAAGALLGGNFPLSDGLGDGGEPRVALNPQANEYLVVWLDDRDERADVYGQRLSAAGVLAGVNFPISTADGDKNKCDVAYSPASGQFLAVWVDTRSDASEIMGQHIDDAGGRVGEPFPIAGGDGVEDLPVVAYDVLTRDFLVVWQALREATDWDILGRRVSGEGAPVARTFALSEAGEVQAFPETVQSARSGEFLTVWQDFRNDSYDIFGRRWIAVPRSRVHRSLPGH